MNTSLNSRKRRIRKLVCDCHHIFCLLNFFKLSQNDRVGSKGFNVWSKARLEKGFLYKQKCRDKDPNANFAARHSGIYSGRN